MLRITSRNSSGFTLIEVMIVIAVIGILSAVAIPAYQKYATRAKVSEVVTIMSELKASVSQCIQSRGGLAECNAVNSDIDENAVAASSDYITEVFVNAGVIRIRPTWSNLGDSSVDGLIELTPELAGSTRWTCRYQNALPSIAQYLPSNCRNEVP